jgi:hypothetical protein
MGSGSVEPPEGSRLPILAPASAPPARPVRRAAEPPALTPAASRLLSAAVNVVYAGPPLRRRIPTPPPVLIDVRA